MASDGRNTLFGDGVGIDSGGVSAAGRRWDAGLVIGGGVVSGRPAGIFGATGVRSGAGGTGGDGRGGDVRWLRGGVSRLVGGTGVAAGGTGVAGGLSTGGLGATGCSAFEVRAVGGALGASASLSRARSRSACSSALKNSLMIPTNV